MITCPNKNLKAWKNLVKARGTTMAYNLWFLHDGIVPEEEYTPDILGDREVNLPSVKAEVTEIFNHHPELAFIIYDSLNLDLQVLTQEEAEQATELYSMYRTMSNVDMGSQQDIENFKAFIEEEINRQQFPVLKELSTTENKVDIAKLQQKLVTEARNRNWALNDIKALELDPVTGNFKIPLWTSTSANRIEALLTSIIDNGIRKQKLPGRSFILGSEAGFKPVLKEGEAAKEFIKNNQSKIIFTKDFDPKVGLTPQNGNKPAQILVSSKFRGVELKKFIDKDGYLDTTKIDPELLKGFGFRIPTQGHNSMSLIQIVGFLPDSMGDLVIAPQDFTKQMGSDFDVDKLYSYFYNYKVIGEEYLETRPDYIDINGKVHTGIKEIVNARQIIKIPSDGNTKEALQNKLLDIHLEVMSHPEVQPMIFEPIGFRELPNLAKEVENAKKIEQLNPLTDTYYKNKYLNARAGSAGRGFFSLLNTFIVSSQDKNIYLREYQNNEEGDLVEVPVNIVFGDENGQPIELNNISNPNSIDKEFKSNTSSALLSAATDDEKEQIFYRTNINPETFYAIGACTAVGFTENYFIPLINQPIIYEYVNLLKQSTDSTNDNFISDAKNKAVNELTIKYLELAGIPVDSELAKDYLDPDSSLTIKDLWASIKNPENKDFYKTQLLALTKFAKARDIGEKLAQIQGAINTDASGIPISIFETQDKEEKIKNLLNHPLVANADTLIGNYITDSEGRFTGEIIPNTINGFASVYGLFNVNALFSPFFPYNKDGILNVFQELSLITNSVTLSSETKQDFFENIKSYIYTNLKTKLDSEEINTLRQKLFFDSPTNKSLATQTEEFKKGVLKNNRFVQRLKTTKDVLGNKPSLIKYDAGAGENLEELDVHQGFADLFRTEETREFAQNLITYFYISGGIQQAIQFGKYIPQGYILNGPFAKFLTSLNFNDESVLGNLVSKTNYYDVSRVTRQIIQHNPSKAPKLKDDLSQIVITNKDKAGLPLSFKIDVLKNPELSVTRVNPITNEVIIAALPEFLSLLDFKAAKNFRLYEYKGNGIYEQIDTLGTFGMDEFNAQNSNQTSLIKDNKSLLTPTAPTTQLTDTRDVIEKSEEFKEIPNPIEANNFVKTYKLDSNSPLSILQTIKNNTTSPLHKILANELIDLLPSTKKFQIQITTDPTKRGSYIYKEHTAYINPENHVSNEEIEKTILHETIHNFSGSVMLKWEKDPDSVTPEQNKIITSLQRLQNVLIKKIESNPVWKVEYDQFLIDYAQKNKLDLIQISKNYGATNLREFVTMALTDTDFQKILNDIPFSEGKSMFERFADLIKSILNSLGFEIKPGSLLEKAVEDSIALTQTYKQTTKPSTQGVGTQTPVANIPQNKVSGVDSYGSTVTANNEVIKALGPNPHSIDMIEAGFRTRTTRSESEMAKYAVRVGDVIKHFGTSVDGTTKNILAKVTAIHLKGSAGWKGTWEKEGWRAQDVNVIDRFKDGAAAIEFEVIQPSSQPVGSVKPGVNELFSSNPELVNIGTAEQTESQTEVKTGPTIRIFKQYGTYYKFTIDENNKLISSEYAQSSLPKDDSKWSQLTTNPLKKWKEFSEGDEIFGNFEEIVVKPTLPKGQILLPNGKIISLNSQQIGALDDIAKWLNSDNLFYTLSGYAGTGKTTIVKEAISGLSSVAVSAPTHKAKKVVKTSTGKSAYTIQALLGLKPNTDIENFDINNPQFDPQGEKKIKDYRLIIIDEASMLNTDLFKLLLTEAKRFNTKILFMGDLAQLPPVNESISQVFVSPKITNKSQLTKVERQADSNPLMLIYDNIRNNIKDSKDNFLHKTEINAEGEGVTFMNDSNRFTNQLASAFNSENYKNNSDFAKVLAYTNASVTKWNKVIRNSIFGESAKPLEEGELLLSYSTILMGYDTVLENSAEYKVKSIKETTNSFGIKGYKITLYFADDNSMREGRELFVVYPNQENYNKFLVEFNKKLDTAKKVKGRAWVDYYAFKNSNLLLEDLRTPTGGLIVKKDLDYGYAMTVHKSQGSTFTNVFVDEDNIDKNNNSEERNKLKYVAFSRPTKRAIVLSEKTFEEDALPASENLKDLKKKLGITKKEMHADYISKIRKNIKNYKGKYIITPKQIGESNYYTFDITEKPAPEFKRDLDYFNGDVALMEQEMLEDALPAQAKKPKTESKYKVIIDTIDSRINFLYKQISKNLNDRTVVDKYLTKITELKNKKDEVISNERLIDVINFGTDDIKHVNDLLKQSLLSESDLHYINMTLHTWESILPILFTEKDLQLINDQYSANVKAIKEIQSNANITRLKYTKAFETAALNMLSKSGIKLTRDQLTAAKKEIGFLSAYLRDISTTDDVISQFLAKKIKEANFKTSTEVTKTIREIDVLVDKVKADPLFKQKGFKLFIQESGGELTGNLVDRKSQLYYNTFSQKLLEARTANSKKSWEAFNAWKRENLIVFDLRLLFNKDYNELDGENTYSKEDIAKHKQDLINQLGQKGYDKYMLGMQKKMDLYKEDLQAAITRIDALEADDAEKQSKLYEWQLENSPFLYASRIYDNKIYKSGDKYISSKGYKYTYEVPRRINKSGKETNFYDEKFSLIENNPVLEEFYNYTMDKLHELRGYLPEYAIDDLQYNYLPEIRKSIAEAYSEKGLGAGLENWYDKFISELSVDESSDISYAERDPLTGKLLNTLPIRMVSDILSPEEKSYDLPKILKAFSLMAVSYKHKSQIEDQVKIAQQLVNQALEKQVNISGEQLRDKNGNLIATKDSLKNFKIQFDYSVEAWYGNKEKVQGKTETKVLTIEEKRIKKSLQLKLANPKLSDEEKEQVQSEIDSLGKNVATSKAFKKFLNFAMYKGMAWNIFAPANNTMFSFVSNLIHASGGEDFTIDEFFKAKTRMLSSIGKSITLDTIESKTAKKINRFIEKFNVIGEINQLSNEATILNSSPVKGLKKLAPMELTRRAEYLNRGTTAMAIAEHIKISNLKGEQKSLWDALDEDGNWKTEEFGEEPEQFLLDFKVRMDQVLKIVHGNYDPDSAVKIKDNVLGQALIMFRSWVAEGFSARFEDEKYDLALGRTRKGRFRTYNPITGGSLGRLQGTKLLLSQMLNFLTFGTTFKSSLDQLSSIDKANMRKNAAELLTYITLYTMILMLKGIKGDSDDDKDKYALNALINVGFRVQNDMAFFTSPMAFEKITQSSLPVMSIITDAAKFVDAAEETIMGNPYYKQGVYKGQARMKIAAARNFPGTTQIIRTIGGIIQENE